jgi:hypothetical protein
MKDLSVQQGLKAGILGAHEIQTDFSSTARLNAMRFSGPRFPPSQSKGKAGC